MHTILAIQLASANASVALVGFRAESLEQACSSGVKGEVLWHSAWEQSLRANAQIFSRLDATLQQKLGMHKPSAIVVGSGPGSYAGVRVALAVADGLALAYDCKCHALCSYNGLASGFLVMDAKRGDVALLQSDAQGFFSAQNMQIMPYAQLLELQRQQPFAQLYCAEAAMLEKLRAEPMFATVTCSLRELDAAALAEFFVANYSRALVEPLEPFYLREALVSVSSKRRGLG